MENIMERMSSIDKTVWTRLSTAITPHLNKIQKEEDKLKKQILIANEKIALWKNEISGYKKMMKEIEDKYKDKQEEGGIQEVPLKSSEEEKETEVANEETTAYDMDDFDPFA